MDVRPGVAVWVLCGLLLQQGRGERPPGSHLDETAIAGELTPGTPPPPPAPPRLFAGCAPVSAAPSPASSARSGLGCVLRPFLGLSGKEPLPNVPGPARGRHRAALGAKDQK